MPELPEVETIARDLHDAVRGARIVGARVFRRDVLREVTPRALERRTRGATMDRWWRRAKHAVADLSNGERIVVSPRFTGAVLIETGAWTEGRHDYTTLVFDLADGRAMRYRDVRRLGTVTIMDASRFAAWEAGLGPEPLADDFSADRFAGRMTTSGRAIKIVLMDQRRLAGIGNIYANEALWRAKIAPTRPANTLSNAELRRLRSAIRAILRASIARRGTSFRDYQDPYGGRGGFLRLARVYSRQGERCLRCDATLRSTHALEGRITVWCPRCQS